MNKRQSKLSKQYNRMTERQKTAVMSSGVPAIITAGAGAGKTSVLTLRIAKIIRDSGKPHQVAALTFTSDAASEMRERLSSLLNSDVAKQCVIATFHSFVQRFILREYWGHPYLKSLGCTGAKFELEHSNITQSYLYKQAANNALNSKQKDSFYDGLKDANTSFSMWLTLTRSYGFTPATYFDSMTTEHESMASLLAEKGNKCDSNELCLKVWHQYDQLMQQREKLDQDQSLVYSMMLMENVAEVRIELKRRFRYVLTDEFQDTNVCQYRLIVALVGDGNKFSAFGDLKQAIYSFRGCNSHLMASIRDQFPQAQVFNLPDNFRSTSNVVREGNMLATTMSDQLIKEDMIPHKESSEPVEAHYFDDATGAASHHWIVDKIIHLKGMGIDPQDIGILYRYNKVGQELENYLINRNVDYRRLGSDKGLYEEDGIRQIVIFMHLLFHPFKNSVLPAFTKDQPKLNITKYELRFAIEASLNASDKKFNNHQVLQKLLSDGAGVPVCQVIINSFSASILELSGVLSRINTFDDFCRSRNVQFSGIPPEDQEAVVKSHGTEYLSACEGFIATLSHHFLNNYHTMLCPDPKQRSIMIKRDKDLIAERFKLVFNGLYDKATAERNITEYICSRPLIEKSKRKEKANTTDVELMTIHASKGLEKKAVFLLGCTEEQWWKDDYDLESDIYAEEKRLFYVAVTRCIEYLNIVSNTNRIFRDKVQCLTRLSFIGLLSDKVKHINHFSKKHD